MRRIIIAAVILTASPCFAATVTSKSGATASVSGTFAPHAQCLINKLDAVGFRIKEMGGYGKRGGPSAHPTGNAIDINQCGFGVLCRYSAPLPVGYVGMAESCGVYSGSRFGDKGHFEMPNKYGYVNLPRYARGGTNEGAFDRSSYIHGHPGARVEAAAGPGSANFH